MFKATGAQAGKSSVCPSTTTNEILFFRDVSFLFFFFFFRIRSVDAIVRSERVDCADCEYVEWGFGKLS